MALMAARNRVLVFTLQYDQGRTVFHCDGDVGFASRLVTR